MTTSKCQGCKNKEPVPGDCHILCKKPPQGTMLLSGPDAGNPKVHEVIRKKVAEHTKKYPGLTVAILMKWKGCGLFPIMFDQNIVVECTNFENDSRCPESCCPNCEDTEKCPDARD